MLDPKAFAIAQIHYEEMRHPNWSRRIGMPQATPLSLRLRVGMGKLLVAWGTALQRPAEMRAGWTGRDAAWGRLYE